MKKSFLDVMIQEAMEDSEVTFYELNEQGGRYYDLDFEYEIVVERAPEVETLLRQHYPEDLFYAYYSNQFDEHERELNVFCLLEEQECVVNFGVKDLQNGKLLVSCFLNIPARLQEIVMQGCDLLKHEYPQFETILLKYLKEQPAYRLHFATKDVEIVFK